MQKFNLLNGYNLKYRLGNVAAETISTSLKRVARSRLVLLAWFVLLFVVTTLVSATFFCLHIQCRCNHCYNRLYCQQRNVSCKYECTEFHYISSKLRLNIVIVKFSCELTAKQIKLWCQDYFIFLGREGKKMIVCSLRRHKFFVGWIFYKFIFCGCYSKQCQLLSRLFQNCSIIVCQFNVSNASINSPKTPLFELIEAALCLRLKLFQAKKTGTFAIQKIRIF